MLGSTNRKRFSFFASGSFNNFRRFFLNQTMLHNHRVNHFPAGQTAPARHPELATIFHVNEIVGYHCSLAAYTMHNHLLSKDPRCLFLRLGEGDLEEKGRVELYQRAPNETKITLGTFEGSDFQQTTKDTALSPSLKGFRNITISFPIIMTLACN